MIDLISLGHINVVVDDIEEATRFYSDAFDAIPVQDFPHFRNTGFAKSAGFMSEAEEVDVSIRFVRLPTHEGLVLELMQYHHPYGNQVEHHKEPNDRNCVGHIALKVTSAERAFEHLKSLGKGRMITDHPEYRPFKIDAIEPEEFRFFDDALESDPAEKQSVCETIGGISYFYFVDPYGIQWELEEGH